MQKSILILVLLNLMILSCFSQSNFKIGYIITNSNDTVVGLIKNNGKNANSLKCIFIEESKSERITYFPNDIKAYKFTTGKYYISKTIASRDNEKMFIEFLFDGIKDLYYYSDISGDHYLIENIESDLIELKNEKMIVTAVNRQAGISSYYSELTPAKYEKESKEYIGVLKNLFIDGPATMKKVESISLSQNSLVDIAQDYHNEVCPDEVCTNYTKRNTKVEFRYGPIAGISFSQISYKATGASFNLDFLPQGKSSGITFGAFINMRDPTFSEKFSMQLEMAYNKAKFSSDISYLNLSTLKIPVLFKYTLPFKEIQPSAMIGMAYNRFLNFENYTKDYGFINLVSGESQYCLVAGIETAWKSSETSSIFFHLRYEYCVGQNHLGKWDYIVGGFNTKLTNINFGTGLVF